MKQQLQEQGFTVVNGIYTAEEVKNILAVIQQADSSRVTFRKTDDLFAIRQALKEMPSLSPIIFNDRLKTLINEFFGERYFVVKSIYFDKPGKSNWFVAWHQDLTISVKEKTDIEGFGPWTVKQDQYAVQPPLPILEQNFTIRIHLDDTDDQNGALKVVPGSHRKGIYRPETINWQEEREVSCHVSQGGVMIMKPLLLHASGRTLNEKNRRVLHVEFSKTGLPAPLQWAEKTTAI
jgi:ectoine hydroxylase-related dioxygenase (phytanoyl-CoA dioxygenase family)